MRGQKWRKWKKWVALAAAAAMLAGQPGVASVRAEEGWESGVNTEAVQEYEEYAPEGEACADGMASVSGNDEEGPGAADGTEENGDEDSGNMEETGGSDVANGNDTAGKDDIAEGSGAVEKEDAIQGNGAADLDDGEGMLAVDQMEPLSVYNAAGNIASGKDGNITWVIDADGKLIVEGTGDLSRTGDVNNQHYLAWTPYNGRITSAKISVKGMTDASGLFSGCGYLTSVDMSGLDTSKVTDMSYMFSNCSDLTSVDLSGLDTSKVTDMSYMFYCAGLTSVDLSGLDTSKVTDIKFMFSGCSSLTSVDLSGLDTSNVTDMSGMFAYLAGRQSRLTSVDLSGLDTSKVTDMSRMFYNCYNLTSVDLSGLDTSNVRDMSFMFWWCRSLINVDLSGFDTSNVTSMMAMFEDCSSLTSVDVSGFDTSNVTDMSYMFGCRSLTSVDVSGFDTSNVTNMSGMFSGCSSLTSVDVSGFDTSNVTDMTWMFSRCSSLTSVDMSGFDTSNVTDMRWMFSDCSGLNTIKTPHKMGTVTTDLPDTFIDARGTERQILSKEFCNTTLYKKGLPAPAPAKFTVVGVIGGRNVTFNTDTKDAVIYYSAKTSSLTTSDACVKPGETVLFENFYGTIYAKAYLNGQWSNVSRLILKIPVVSKPTITSKDGVVTIKTATPDSYIYYTTDGSTPSPANGTRLAKSGGSFTVPANCTVKAIAVRSCFTNSEIVSAKVAARKLGAPSFVVKGVIGGREVTFNTTETKGEIYYSFTSSNISTKDRHVKPGEKVLFQNYYGTVYAKTYVDGQWSNVSRLILKIPVVNKPTITATGNGRVKISTSTPNCAIYYTTDGSTPSPTNGTRINSSSSIVTVGSGRTVKAIAVRSCFTNSDVATYIQ